MQIRVNSKVVSSASAKARDKQYQLLKLLEFESIFFIEYLTWIGFSMTSAFGWFEDEAV